MKKMTANEVARLTAAADEVSSILDEMDLIRTHAESEFERLIGELSTPMEEARGLLEDAANAAEEYYDERSEKWMEGDTGTAYAEWKETLRGLADDAGTDIEAPQIAEIERPDWVDRASNADFVEFEP
jgi:hypothetical protein